MIRLADYPDITAIVNLFEEVAERSTYSVNVDRITARQIVTHCIAAHNAGVIDGVIFVSDVDGEIDGVFVGALRRFYEITDIYMASNLLWYVKTGSKAAWPLLAAFEDWLKDVDGRVILQFGINDAIVQDPQRFGMAMGRKGYRSSGVILEKEL